MRMSNATNDGASMLLDGDNAEPNGATRTFSYLGPNTASLNVRMNGWQTMADGEFEFGFAVEWMRKDLKIALDEAERNGAALDMTRLVDDYYAEVQELGGNRWDTSSLIARLEKQ